MLIATLQSPASAPEEKAIASQRLAIIGTKQSVPALAALLRDEKLSHLARQALEPMPDPAAGAALREALGQVQGDLLAGVVNSIGLRRDAAATDALVALLRRADRQIASAAAAALGRIGTVDAANKLQAELNSSAATRHLPLADACLGCAERLIAAQRRDAARVIYEKLCGTAYPDHIRTAAMRGAILLREDAGASLLLEQLRGDDRAMQAAAWGAARALPGPGVTKALAAELPNLPVAKQAAMLQILAERGDREAGPAVLAAAKSPAGEVRLAAIAALPRVDPTGESFPLLLGCVAEGSSTAETEAAVVSLGQIGGTDVNPKLLAALPGAAPAGRARLLTILGVRRVASARGELMKHVDGPEAEVSKAALRALALVGRPADLPELIRLSMACRDETVKVAADLAIFSVAMKVEPPARRADAVIAALRSAPTGQAKCSLLRPLGAIVKAMGGSAPAFEGVEALLNHPDAQAHDAALRCLADWPDATPAPLLLEIAKREPANRELALRGGIRMAANVAAGRDATPLAALPWFTEANRLVRTTPEKLMMVSGLGSLKNSEGLRMLQPYLDDPAVQTEAALAVMEIAPALSGPEQALELRRVLDRILGTTQDADVRRKAGKLAKSLPKKDR